MFHGAPAYSPHVGYVNYWLIRETRLCNILLPKCGIPHWRRQVTFYSGKVSPTSLCLVSFDLLRLQLREPSSCGLAAQPMHTAPRQDFPPCLDHFPFSPSERCVFPFPENQTIRVLLQITRRLSANGDSPGTWCHMKRRSRGSACLSFSLEK